MTDHTEDAWLRGVERIDGKTWLIGRNTHGDDFGLATEDIGLVEQVERYARENPDGEGLHVTLDLSDALKYPFA